MPNIKISAATDIGTPHSSDMLPLARVGDTNAYHATMAEIAAFAGTTVSSGAYGNVGRNLLHNARFDIQQRGVGPYTPAVGSSGYVPDRWEVGVTAAGSITATLISLTDANRAAIADESAVNGFQLAVTGSANAASQVFATQPIEGVHRLSNTTVTMSFWAWANTGTPKLGVSLDQNLGTGGSPSATVPGTGQSVTIGTTPVRYSMTFNIPSAAGKTLGTNGNDATELNLWFSAGSNSNSASGSVGNQSATFTLWGMQLEIGSVATPMEKLDLPWQLAECQRFYQAGAALMAGYALAGTNVWGLCFLPVTMRGRPTVTTGSTAGNANVGSIVWSASLSAVIAETTVSADGGFVVNTSFTASADL